MIGYKWGLYHLVYWRYSNIFQPLESIGITHNIIHDWLAIPPGLLGRKNILAFDTCQSRSSTMGGDQWWSDCLRSRRPTMMSFKRQQLCKADQSKRLVYSLFLITKDTTKPVANLIALQPSQKKNQTRLAKQVHIHKLGQTSNMWKWNHPRQQMSFVLHQIQ